MSEQRCAVVAVLGAGVSFSGLYTMWTDAFYDLTGIGSPPSVPGSWTW